MPNFTRSFKKLTRYRFVVLLTVLTFLEDEKEFPAIFAQTCRKLATMMG